MNQPHIVFLSVFLFFLFAPTASIAADLGADDIAKIKQTYKDNEARFKRDYKGKTFEAELPFVAAKENMFTEGKYTLGFGSGSIFDDVSCETSDTATVNVVIDWNKGDTIVVSGVVDDSLMTTIKLVNCKFVKK